MSNPILVNDNLVNFTSLVTLTGWQTVDLAPYLNHDDPKMVIVVIHIGAAGNNKYVGCKPVGSVLLDTYTVLQTAVGVYQFPCSLAGGTTIQVYAPSDLAGVTYFIHAEIGGDDAVIYNDLISVQHGTYQWGTVDSTARFGADAGKVVASILLVGHSPNGNYSYRSFGSTDTFLSASFAWGNTFGICGVDRSNRYQTYQTVEAGKGVQPWNSFYWEAGYILRNWNHIENPVDRNLIVAATWTDEDITDITEEAATIALIRYYHIGSSGNRTAWMRKWGAILQGPLWIQFTFTMHCLVELTSEQVYQYWITDSNVHQYILGWYAKAANILTIDRGELTIDRSTLTIG